MVEVVPYNPKWPEIFKREALSLKEDLGDNFIDIHHIGSTSVEGLRAKPKIDILAVVKDLKKVSQLGYRFRGEFNIPFHCCYTKRDEGGDINLHIVEEDSLEIEINLLFRDYLRNNQQVRDQYESLKMELLKQESSHVKNDSMFVGYTLGKNDFISNVLKLSGFDKLYLRFVTHHAEWEAYHRIRKELLFDGTKIKYDPNHVSIKYPQNRHFVLYKGADIIGVAQVEFLSLSEAVLRPFAIDTPYQNQGLGSQFLLMIEKWIKQQGREIIRLNAEPKALNFYQRLGYSFMKFDDPHNKIRDKTIDMGKVI
jgi:GrpB-like predicted nucleotidyltransferase (UPF0157 family)/GNAT superfamily N-acetyltransferase